MQAALERGLAPDDETLKQLTQEQDSPFEGMTAESLRWPDEPLRSILIREALPRTVLSSCGMAWRGMLLHCACRQANKARHSSLGLRLLIYHYF